MGENDKASQPEDLGGGFSKVSTDYLIKLKTDIDALTARTEQLLKSAQGQDRKNSELSAELDRYRQKESDWERQKMSKDDQRKHEDNELRKELDELKAENKLNKRKDFIRSKFQELKLDDEDLFDSLLASPFPDSEVEDRIKRKAEKEAERKKDYENQKQELERYKKSGPMPKKGTSDPNASIESLSVTELSALYDTAPEEMRPQILQRLSHLGLSQ